MHKLKHLFINNPFSLLIAIAILILANFGLISEASAHGVTAGDKGFIQESSGALIVPFMYLGAKHMITGYDHLLFLVGVIFYLYRFRDVGIYVSLFALGQ